jgi:hypothetical protein
MRLQNIFACVQKYHTVFLVPLLGNTTPSDDAKKHQQAFLASLPGKALV